ncbi:GNAT family N-acetyltransferase [Glycomyces harbinensis]|uniref:N-acetylglutamate synthase, GNAT family n=1 Tax=Glycomyces harbinensis TaxID=58114 RepID=A0A1G7CCX8_9ACTN|nr:GNAT family N-acetyltransferase [Glycomyces harbinensis]SDE36566.1 N-acetylglutamate synthase, GNAT family [Glycomyces harbinensis]
MGSEDYTISSDPDRLDRDWIHEAISTDTYWATGRSREDMDRAIEHSLPYGLYDGTGRQLAFARLVTDQTYFAWLSDVYVDRSARGKGVGKLLMRHLVEETEKMNLRRVMLATSDAQGLYGQFDFTEIDDDYAWMYRVRPGRD